MKDRDKMFLDILDDDEWRNAKAVCVILKLFYDCKFLFDKVADEWISGLLDSSM